MSDYEKHQRDYTVLGTTVVAEELYGDGMGKFFSYKPKPLFLFVEDGIFYHLLSKSDYAGWPQAYFADHSYAEFEEFAKSHNPKLDAYWKFFEQEPEDLVAAIDRLHKYFQEFMSIIMIAAYAPDHVKDLDKRSFDLCVEMRGKLENVHKFGMSKEEEWLSILEKQSEIKKGSLKNLTIDEFRIFLDKKELPQDIDNRRSFLLMKISYDGYNFYTSEEKESVLEKIGQTKVKNVNIDIIKGIKSFGGVVKGRVKIVKTVEGASRVEEGDILVSSMTDPRYLVAMKKASAFVTDEGGILCHAAIVARELKKPCIISTKIATQVLKNGDIIEVDANRGIVKILNK